MNRLMILLLVFTACAELDPPTLIKRDRMLGAKVTVDGDPERAWPARGELATVTWVTASPGETPTFSWIIAACPAATSSGIPACAGPIFANEQAQGPVPTLQLVVPVDMAATAVVVTGAICASGTPSFDPATATAECDDGSRVDIVSQHIFLTTADATNHNPNIARAPFTFDGTSWAHTDQTECGDALPVVKAGSDRKLIGVAFDDSDLELFSTESGPSREDLQLAAFATAGEVLQHHTYVDPDDGHAVSPVALEWDPPSAEDVPAGGLRVKFHFVVRDMRGGIDATTRELCVR
jgi:hypothetical protein